LKQGGALLAIAKMDYLFAEGGKIAAEQHGIQY
jgi:hypothetical protein